LITIYQKGWWLIRVREGLVFIRFQRLNPWIWRRKRKLLENEVPNNLLWKILLLSKAWVSASENTLVSMNQRISTFWVSLLQA
jgi:hypothetical protein